MKLSQDHKDIIAYFNNIIKDVEILPVKSHRQIKVKFTFIDNSNLRLTEIIYQNKAVAYNYYYLDENNQLIIGWDTAPHHKHLRNFPYHKHTGNDRKTESSSKMNLKKVLDYINEKIKRRQ